MQNLITGNVDCREVSESICQTSLKYFSKHDIVKKIWSDSFRDTIYAGINYWFFKSNSLNKQGTMRKQRGQLLYEKGCTASVMGYSATA
jgi:hypothetical protein